MTPLDEDDGPGERAPLTGFTTWVDALLRRRDPAICRAGTFEQADDVIQALAETMRTGVWNMQRTVGVTGLRQNVVQMEWLRRHGLSNRMIYPSAAVVESPMITSAMPGLRLGPVPEPMMLMDCRLLVVGHRLDDSLWTSTDATVVEAAVAHYERLWNDAVPAVPDGQAPPFAPRMVQVGVLMSEGRSDREIAGRVGVSERTVSAEVAEIGRRLGTSSRAASIARICGASA